MQTVPAVPVTGVKLVELPYHPAENGDLVVVEGLVAIPFSIVRIFIVNAPAAAIRGQHAHRACAQFLICSRGRVEVSCDDGTATATYMLDRPNVGLLVPPTIWSEQVYCDPGSVLTVLCDRRYEAADYIRDYAVFKAFRGVGA